jgi:hypothetical protein
MERARGREESERRSKKNQVLILYLFWLRDASPLQRNDRYTCSDAEPVTVRALGYLNHGIPFPMSAQARALFLSLNALRACGAPAMIMHLERPENHAGQVRPSTYG